MANYEEDFERDECQDYMRGEKKKIQIFVYVSEGNEIELIKNVRKIR